MTLLKIKKCSECDNKFMGSNKTCNDCLGVQSKIDGAPSVTDYSRLGDNHCKKGSSEWQDLLRKIKKENPGSTIDVK